MVAIDTIMFGTEGSRIISYKKSIGALYKLCAHSFISHFSLLTSHCLLVCFLCMMAMNRKALARGGGNIYNKHSIGDWWTRD